MDAEFLVDALQVGVNGPDADFQRFRNRFVVAEPAAHAGQKFVLPIGQFGCGIQICPARRGVEERLKLTLDVCAHGAGGWPAGGPRAVNRFQQFVRRATAQEITPIPLGYGAEQFIAVCKDAVTENGRGRQTLLELPWEFVVGKTREAPVAKHQLPPANRAGLQDFPSIRSGGDTAKSRCLIQPMHQHSPRFLFGFNHGHLGATRTFHDWQRFVVPARLLRPCKERGISAGNRVRQPENCQCEFANVSPARSPPAFARGREINLAGLGRRSPGRVTSQREERAAALKLDSGEEFARRIWTGGIGMEATHQPLPPVFCARWEQGIRSPDVHRRAEAVDARFHEKSADRGQNTGHDWRWLLPLAAAGGVLRVAKMFHKRSVAQCLTD